MFGLACGLAATAATPVPAQVPELGLTRPRPSPWFSPENNGVLRCRLCPKQCRIAPGRRGDCHVRENRNGQGYTLAWGNPSLVQLDQVERNPFFHVLPGTRALSLCTAGCPLACNFCEVWNMAQVAPEEVYAYDLTPEQVIAHARSAGARAISYAFGEPVAFYEYMAAIAILAKKAGLLNLMHTSGYIAAQPLAQLAGSLDAVNVDLKSFDDRFYHQMTGGTLAPVLDSLRLLKKHNVHIEVTNLIIPTLTDDVALVRHMAGWIKTELGPGTPLHLARFYPLYKLANLPPTPVATLDRLRQTALDEGLEHVYVARVTGHVGENTFCPACGAMVIERTGFVIERIRLDPANGHCHICGNHIAGRWLA